MSEQIHFFTYGNRVAPHGWYQKNPPGIHRFYLILGGEGQYTDSDGKHEFEKNCFYLFPQNIPFKAQQNENNPINHMFFDFSIVPPLKTTCVSKLHLNDDCICKQLSDTLIMLFKENPRDDYTIKKVFAVLLHRFCKILNLENITDKRIQSVLMFIHNKYQTPITNAQMAELVHLDENHFIRIFNKSMGITPYKYLLRYRLNVAANMLMDGKSVYETAISSGFSDSASLSHTMKRETGLTPSELKPQ